jgi:hypothetical protein
MLFILFKLQAILSKPNKFLTDLQTNPFWLLASYLSAVRTEISGRYRNRSEPFHCFGARLHSGHQRDDGTRLGGGSVWGRIPVILYTFQEELREP